VSSALRPSFSNSFCRTAVSATVVGQNVLVGSPTRMVSALAADAVSSADITTKRRDMFINFLPVLCSLSLRVAMIVNRKAPFLQLTLW